METKERLKKITEFWFLTEPLLFAAYCTHELTQNNKMKVPFRTGMRRIEFNSDILKDLSDKQTAEYLKIEVLRIILKHPYQRLPPFPNRKVLTYASNITIADSYTPGVELSGVNRWPLPKKLCFEEYYNKVFAILATPPVENGNFGETIIPPDFPVSPSEDDEDSPSDSNGNSSDSEQEAENNSSKQNQESVSGKGPSAEQPANNNSSNKESGENSNKGNPTGQSTEEETSALWEEDEDICCDINNLIEIAEASNTWGTLSGNFIEVIKASKLIPMDYRKMLSAFKTSIISSKRSLTRMRPSRRFGFAYMGSRYILSTNLLIAVDVSGSVTSASLRNFFSIINRFFKNGIEKLDVIQFDHDLKTEEPIPFKKAKHEVKIIGRGGTSFQPAADYYCIHPEYDGLIYFTDGYAEEPVFNTKRPIDVLWILTGKKEYESHKEWIKKLARNRATYIPD